MQKVIHGQSKNWFEGLFALLLMKLLVDDLRSRSKDLINDTLTLHFRTTKANETGESTNKLKHLYANPFCTKYLSSKI